MQVATKWEGEMELLYENPSNGKSHVQLTPMQKRFRHHRIVFDLRKIFGRDLNERIIHHRSHIASRGINGRQFEMNI